MNSCFEIKSSFFALWKDNELVLLESKQLVLDTVVLMLDDQ